MTPSKPQPNAPTSLVGAAEGPAATVPSKDPELSTEASEVDALLALSGSASTSHGGPGNGTLEGGVALPVRGPGFVHNARRPRQARYGSVELVQAIMRAAAVTDEAFPGSGLVVNDLSLQHGGPIRQHGSHQNGRDADILFYALDGQGEPLPAVGVPLDPRGRGWDFKQLADPKDDVRVRLDRRRTWRFMQALLEVAGEHVQRIFIVEHVRSLLLAEAKRQKAPRALVERFAQVACQPGSPHDDHMHVRFYCTAEDLRDDCRDKPPIYPWHRRALAAADLQPMLARPLTRAQRKAISGRTTTPAQARKRAGRMHRKVIQFLAERKAWQSKPSPGRPYCR